MGLVEILVLGTAIWLCIYALVDRICRCFESCALCKSYGSYMSKGVPIKIDDFLKAMANTGGNKNQEK